MGEREREGEGEREREPCMQFQPYLKILPFESYYITGTNLLLRLVISLFACRSSCSVLLSDACDTCIATDRQSVRHVQNIYIVNHRYCVV